MYHFKQEHVYSRYKTQGAVDLLYLIKHELRAFLFAKEFSISVDVVKAEKIETKFS